MDANIKIYPEIGNPYTVIIKIPENTPDTNTWVENWIDENLNFVNDYKFV